MHTYGTAGRKKSVCKSRQKFVEVNDNLCTRLLDPLIYIAHATKVFRYLPQIIKKHFSSNSGVYYLLQAESSD